MKYDLIISGGGPAGLMAAKTAAEAGLKTVLFERKKVIHEVKRLCGQFTNISLINVSGKLKYGYTEPLNIEVTNEGAVLHFPAAGFSFSYQGPLRPYMNYVYLSPSAQPVYREKEHCFGFYIDKESLLKCLYDEALTAGAEIITETMTVEASDSNDGVCVRVQNGGRISEITSQKFIIADGHGSLAADSLGFNKKRAILPSGRIRVMGYVMEGVDCKYGRDSWVNITIPEINRRSNFWMYLQKNGMNIVGGSGDPENTPAANVKKLVDLPAFRPWFKKAEIRDTVAVASPQVRYGPLLEPFGGNTLVIGDAAALVESTNPGAMASGFLGVKALISTFDDRTSEMDGYIEWWGKALDTNDTDYLMSAGRNFIVNYLCNNEEIDFLYSLIGDQVGVPGTLIAKNLPNIEKIRPGLYKKLKGAGLSENLDEVRIDLNKVLDDTSS